MIVKMDEPSEDRTLLRGDTLGRYEILTLLGAGGMGVVYRARDPSLDREVALKLVRTDLVADPGSSRARLLREAQAMARVSHPNVVPIYDVGVAGRDVFIAMELVNGSSLPQWLRERPRSAAAIVGVFIDVGRGLAAVHAAGLVHRDLKPSNVIVDGERARLLDFGLARASGVMSRDTEPGAVGSIALPGSLSSQLTEAGSVLGTPAYMAPEQMLADAEVDARADQYALCAALYHALHGKLPFEAATMAELWHAKQREHTAAITPVEGLAREADAIARRGLAADPSARWPSMDALVAALERARAPRRSRWWPLGGALLGTAGLAALVAFVAPSGRDEGCEAEDPLTGIWDDERRPALQSAWQGSGVPFQEQAWPRVQAYLDAYANPLRAQLRAVCEVAAAAAPAADPRTACLLDRRRRLAAVIDALALADAGAVEAGLSWVTALPRVESCEDERYLGRALAEPATPEQAHTVAQLRERLARAAAMDEAGRSDAARAEVEDVLASAESLGYAPLEAEARVRLGRLHVDGTSSEPAIEALSRGYFLAVEQGHDAVALDAAIALVDETRQASRLDEAAQWLRTAESLLAAVGDEPSLHNQVLRQRGHLELTLDHTLDAIASFEQVLAIERETHGDEHPRVADALLDLGTALRRQEGRELETRRVLEDALSAAARAYDPSHPAVAGFHNALANVLVQLGELDSALEHYTRAEAITRAAYGDGTPKLAGYLLNRAHIHIAREEFDAARVLDLEALALFEAAGGEGPGVAMALNNLGIAYRGLRDEVSATRSFRRALDVMVARWGPSHPQVASLHRNLGESLVAQGRVDDAIRELDEVLAQAEHGRVALDDLAAARYALAIIAWDRGDREVALARARQALGELEGLGVAFAVEATTVRTWIDEHAAP